MLIVESPQKRIFVSINSQPKTINFLRVESSRTGDFSINSQLPPYHSTSVLAQVNPPPNTTINT